MLKGHTDDRDPVFVMYERVLHTLGRPGLTEADKSLKKNKRIC